MFRLPEFLVLLALLALITGCPNRPADDDDVDDDDSGDDDDATEPDPWLDYCEPRDLPPLDLTDADTVARAAVALWLTSVSYSEFSEALWFLEHVLSAGDGTCPAIDPGLPPNMDDPAFFTMIGGCDSSDFFAFGGEADFDWQPRVLPDGREVMDYELTGREFSVTALPSPGRGFGAPWDYLALDGTYSFTLIEDELVWGSPANPVGLFTWALDGLLVEEVSPAALAEGLPVDWQPVFPEGIYGSLQSEGTSPGDGLATATVAGDLTARCRSDLSVEFDVSLRIEAPACAPGELYWAGPLRLWDDDHDVVIDPEGLGGCGRCLPWTVDGLPQPSALCALDLVPGP